MRKNLVKKNEGFTLVEIIVVLVIMGLLLAMAVPSVMGYIGKANDSKLISDARAGYMGAQTIALKAKAKEEQLAKTATTETASASITKELVNAEIGVASTAVETIACSVDANGDIAKCSITLPDLEDKFVNIEANKEGVIAAEAVVK